MAGLRPEGNYEIINRLVENIEQDTELKIQLPGTTNTFIEYRRQGPNGWAVLSLLKQLKDRSEMDFRFEDYHFLVHPERSEYLLRGFGVGRLTFWDHAGGEAHWLGSKEMPPLRLIEERPLTHDGREIHPRFDPPRVRQIGGLWAKEIFADTLLAIEECLDQVAKPNPPTLDL